METVTIPKEKFNKVISDVEVLIEDVVSIFSQDNIAEKRLKEIKETPSIGKSESELDNYLKKRGVKIE